MPEFSTEDLYGPLLSLADRKSISVSEKLAEKKAAMAESQVLTDAKAAQARLLSGDNSPSRAEDLFSLANSSIRQSGQVLSDFAKGETRPNEEIQRQEDIKAGVSEQARQELVTQPTQEVMESVAQASLALDKGDYLEAIRQGGTAALQGVEAAPGILADSANVVPEIIAGAAGTAVAGSGFGVLANRARKLFNSGEKFVEGVKKAKKALSSEQLAIQAAKTLPKTAAQMSVATSTITQRQISDFEAEHGKRPSNERIAQMYAINLATMTAEGGILKQLFVPKFKSEFIQEAKAVVKNLKSGSNLVSMGARVGKGMQKAFAAGGAEAVQEYVQTWAEIINVGVGEDENFLKGLKREIGTKDKQIEAAAGAFLGFGAGGVARAAISAPAVAAGTALDATKATGKGAVKTVVGGVKLAGKGVAAVANQASFKVLSQEERDIISSEHESKKVVADAAVERFTTAVDTVKAASTADELRRNPPVAEVVDAYLESKGLTQEDLQDSKTLSRVKHAVVRAYKADIALIKTELEASNLAAIAKRSGKNIQAKSVQAAEDVVTAVTPTIEAATAAVKDLGPKAKQAVEEIRSSTALGMIELAGKASKKEAAAIVTAAKSLSMDDLKRTTNVINQIKPEIGRRLEGVVRAKEKALKRTGLKVNEIVNNENLNPIIRDVAKRAQVAAGEVAAVSSAVNDVVARRIDDLVALKDTETAVAAIEKSRDFKEQLNGAMTKENLESVKRKLAKARVRLEGEALTTGEQVVRGVKDAVAAATPVVKGAVKAATDAVKEATETKIEVDPKLREQLGILGKVLTNPTEAKDLIARIPGLVKRIQASGIETRKQFEAFIEEFPELQNDVAFFKELDEAFPSDLTAKEVFDNMKTKGVDILEEIKKAYNEINIDPECKV